MRGRFLIAWMLALCLPAVAAEREVTLKSTPGDLHGTLVSAGGPAILILTDTAPADRDGNSSAGGLHTDDYKLLAQDLAAQGITSLRIDQRGVAQSAGADLPEKDLRFKVYADDALAWAAQLRQRTGQPCVWLLGHGEGSAVAELAAQNPAGLCGLVLISGMAHKEGDILRGELGPQMTGALRKQTFDTIAQLEKGHMVANPPPLLEALFRVSVQPYAISWFAVDPPALLKKIKLPVLILHGDTDLKVPVADAHLLAAVKPDAKLVIVPDMNHVLKSAPTFGPANLGTYMDPHVPLAPGLTNAIAAFVKGRP